MRGARDGHVGRGAHARAARLHARASSRAAWRTARIGMSTGLYYAPGSYSTTEEVIALARVAARHGGIYDSHMRDESSYTIGLIGAINETIRIGREAQHPRPHLAHQGARRRRVGAERHRDRADQGGARRRRERHGGPVSVSRLRHERRRIAAAALGRSGRARLAARCASPIRRSSAKLVAEMESNLVRRGGAASLLITSTRDSIDPRQDARAGRGGAAHDADRRGARDHPRRRRERRVVQHEGRGHRTSSWCSRG